MIKRIETSIIRVAALRLYQLSLVVLTLNYALLGWAQEPGLESPSKWTPDQATTIIVPSNPGGGWDQTARFLQRSILEEDLFPASLEVLNRGGGGGTIALAELVEQYAGRSDKLMVTGFGMVGSSLMHGSDYAVDDVTPIARLTGEFQVIAVAANSKYQTIDGLLDDFRSNPTQISWAGGSAGGSDQIFIVQVAEALGISPAKVNYVAFTGGGEANAALMGEQVTAAITGFGEISSLAESGRVRLLAVSSDTRIVDPNLPTFRERGVDVVFQNWRGIVAPPGITDAQRAYFTDLIRAARQSPFWQQALARNNWQDSYLTGAEFAQFLIENRERTAKTLSSIGLGKSSEISAIGPNFFPRIVAAGLFLSGTFILWPMLRRREVAASVSENVSTVIAPRWTRFGLTIAGVAAYIFGLATVGFLIATPLFIFGVSQLIASQNRLRDACLAIAMTGIIYALFELLLNVKVPAGGLF